MLRRVCNVATTVLIVLILSLAALFTVPQWIGYLPYTVLSGSMEPSYPVGSIVFVSRAAPEEVQVNDVIMFTLADGTLVTHRVVDILPEEQAFVTKGDANNAADFTPVPFENMVGKAKFCIPLLGFLAVFLKTGIGMTVFCIVLASLILVEFLPQFIKGRKEAAKAPQ